MNTHIRAWYVCAVITAGTYIGQMSQIIASKNQSCRDNTADECTFLLFQRPLLLSRLPMARPLMLIVDNLTDLFQAFELSSGNLVKEFKVSPRLNAIAVSPHHNHIVIGTLTEARVLDPETMDAVLAFPSPDALTAAFSPDGRFLALGCIGAILLYDVVNGFALLEERKGDFVKVFSVNFSPSSGCLVTGSADHLVEVWSVPDMARLRVLEGHADEVNSTIFLSDNVIVSGGDDRTVRVWDAATGACTNVLTGHDARINFLAVSPQGTLFASGSRDNTLRIYATTDYTLVALIECANSVSRMIFQDEATLFACVLESSPVRVDIQASHVAAVGTPQRWPSGIMILRDPCPPTLVLPPIVV